MTDVLITAKTHVGYATIFWSEQNAVSSMQLTWNPIKKNLTGHTIIRFAKSLTSLTLLICMLFHLFWLCDLSASSFHVGRSCLQWVHLNNNGLFTSVAVHLWVHTTTEYRKLTTERKKVQIVVEWLVQMFLY